MASPIQDGLTAQEIADALGVTKQTVYNWLRTEDLPHSSTQRGKLVKLRDLIDWHIRRADRDPVKPVKSAAPEEPEGPAETYDAALARKTRADADLQELRLAKARGEVVALPDVEKVLAASVKATQTQVLAVPSRLAPQMLGIEDLGRAVRVLSDEMTQLLTNLATIDAIREASGMAAEDGA